MPNTLQEGGGKTYRGECMSELLKTIAAGDGEWVFSPDGSRQIRLRDGRIFLVTTKPSETKQTVPP